MNNSWFQSLGVVVLLSLPFLPSGKAQGIDTSNNMAFNDVKDTLPRDLARRRIIQGDERFIAIAGFVIYTPGLAPYCAVDSRKVNVFNDIMDIGDSAVYLTAEKYAKDYNKYLLKYKIQKTKRRKEAIYKEICISD